MSLNIRILFGTETGNAEDCAHMLGTALERKGYAASVTDMDAYTPTDLAHERLALIVTSTYGNGDPPYNAEELMAWLTNDDASVQGVSFAVCGLGDRTYPKFGQAGKDFDRLMEERGGQRVVPRTDCDVDYEGTFEEFQDAVIAWLETNAESLISGTAQTDTNPPTAETETKSPLDAPLGTRSNPVSAVLRNRYRINKGDSKKETIHYEFEWAGRQVQFQPGDSFAVLPHNNPNEVHSIVSALGLSASDPVHVDGQPTTLFDALTTTRDLQNIPTELLESMAGSGPMPTVDADDHLFDILLKYPTNSMEAQTLIDGLRKMKPRLYSVANSPLVQPEGVHFTVETLRYSHNGRNREGVATTWMADRLHTGDVVPMYCVQAPHFRIPEQPEIPMIMVGPGTGIAPFRAFLQQRRAQAASGENWLFFGHQHQAHDYLYEEEIQRFVADGTLDKISLAWSRDQDHKVYVQHLIANQGSEIWAWLERGAHVYVCGDKMSMAPEVRATIVDIAIKYGGLSSSAAEELLSQWEHGGRYSVDAY